MSQAVKRACDACHRRKVKCDGINPCRNCSSAQLSCTYNAIPQKKGPKGSRAKVISELRETQRQTSLSAKVQNRINGIACPPTNSGLSPTPGLVTGEMVKECVNFFFDHMYAQLPILDRHQVEQQIIYMEQNTDSYCLLTSLCAFIMLQPGMSMPTGDPFNLDMLPGANIVSSQLLLEECLRVRKGYEYLDSISLNTLATNFFIFGCYHGQEMVDRAWYHLREATTMIHMIGMDKEEFYHSLDASDSTRRRRLYWLLYSIERSYAMQRGRPMTLQSTINMPTANDDPNDAMSHQLTGFISMVNLFRPFDSTFLSIWNKTRGQLSAQYLTGLQKQLVELVQSYQCQDSSIADLHINQQWLRSTVWQLTNGNVSGEESMSFQFPGDMARELLLNMASHFSNQTNELVNAGLIEKLVETVYSLNEYLSVQPASRDPFTLGPRQFLEQLLTIVAVVRNGDYRFLPLLLNKVTEVLPRLANPMLQNAPENMSLANIDIFDGFGNAGMAQPPPQMQLPMEDYDRKFPVEEYDKQYSMDMQNSTPDSTSNSNHSGAQTASQGSDMKGSFVSSPGIMSPGLEYSHSHNMNGFACTPISDMVMSPLGNQPNPLNTGQPQHQHLATQQVSRTPGVNGGMTSPHPMNGGMYAVRQAPQRQQSFHLQHPPQMRTVGDFQGLQRGTGDNGMVEAKYPNKDHSSALGEYRDR
ncbi:fungal zn(2)-Cys(6) binuclear cluster domain-containing protein [Sarocladium implicatum]|nr:fungal zn(2)-Cys(6) binuclear cluster domain-containing protein [Sarocladium implicatum]